MHAWSMKIPKSAYNELDSFGVCVCRCGPWKPSHRPGWRGGWGTGEQRWKGWHHLTRQVAQPAAQTQWSRTSFFLFQPPPPPPSFVLFCFLPSVLAYLTFLFKSSIGGRKIQRPRRDVNLIVVVTVFRVGGGGVTTWGGGGSPAICRCTSTNAFHKFCQILRDMAQWKSDNLDEVFCFQFSAVLGASAPV